jgi:hypothetical protein
VLGLTKNHRGTSNILTFYMKMMNILIEGGSVENFNLSNGTNKSISNVQVIISFRAVISNGQSKLCMVIKPQLFFLCLRIFVE